MPFQGDRAIPTFTCTTTTTTTTTTTSPLCHHVKHAHCEMTRRAVVLAVILSILAFATVFIMSEQNLTLCLVKSFTEHLEDVAEVAKTKIWASISICWGGE